MTHPLALCAFPNIGVVRIIESDGPDWVRVLDSSDTRRLVHRSFLTFLPRNIKK